MKPPFLRSIFRAEPALMACHKGMNGTKGKEPRYRLGNVDRERHGMSYVVSSSLNFDGTLKYNLEPV
ncbi:MAG: hypothetical protein AB3N16_01675 [Flavobacteriaceae bacterium]